MDLLKKVNKIAKPRKKFHKFYRILVVELFAMYAADVSLRISATSKCISAEVLLKIKRVENYDMASIWKHVIHIFILFSALLINNIPLVPLFEIVLKK